MVVSVNLWTAVSRCSMMSHGTLAAAAKCVPARVAIVAEQMPP